MQTTFAKLSKVVKSNEPYKDRFSYEPPTKRTGGFLGNAQIDFSERGIPNRSVE